MALPAKPAALYLDKLDIQVMTTASLAPDPAAACTAGSIGAIVAGFGASRCASRVACGCEPGTYRIERPGAPESSTFATWSTRTRRDFSCSASAAAAPWVWVAFRTATGTVGSVESAARFAGTRSPCELLPVSA